MEFRYKEIKIFLYRIKRFPSDKIKELFQTDPSDYTTEKILRSYGLDWQDMFEKGYRQFNKKWDKVIRDLKMELFSGLQSRTEVEKIDITDEITSAQSIVRGLDIKNDFSFSVCLNPKVVMENDIVAVDIIDYDNTKRRLYQGWVTRISESIQPGQTKELTVDCSGLYKFLSLTTIVSDPAISSQFEESLEIVNPEVTPFSDLFTGQTITRIFYKFMHNVLNLSSDEDEAVFDKKQFEADKKKGFVDKIDYVRKINYYGDKDRILERGYKEDVGAIIKKEIDRLRAEISRLNREKDEDTNIAIAELENEIEENHRKITETLRAYRKFNVYVLLIYLWFEAFSDSSDIEFKKIGEKKHPIIAKFDLGDWKGLDPDRWQAPVAWLESIKSNFQYFYSSLATPLEKIKAAMTISQYEFFENDRSQLVVRPPEYNRVGVVGVEENVIDESKLKTVEIEPYVVFEDEIVSNIAFSKDDSGLRTRRDNYMSLPLIGTLPFRGGHYTDLNLLMKYGLRAEAPSEHPFARNETLAGIISAFDLVDSNASTRTGSLTVIAKDKFQIGKLVYIPKYKKVGYINNVSLSFNLNSGVATKTLSLIYVRNVEKDGDILRFRRLPIITDISPEVLRQIEKDQQTLSKDERIKDRLKQDGSLELTPIVADRFMVDIREVEKILLEYVEYVSENSSMLSKAEKKLFMTEKKMPSFREIISFSADPSIFNIDRKKIKNLLVNYLIRIMDYNKSEATDIYDSRPNMFRSFHISDFPSPLITKDLITRLVALDVITEMNFGIITSEKNQSYEDEIRNFTNAFYDEEPNISKYKINSFLPLVKDNSAIFENVESSIRISQVVRSDVGYTDLLSEYIAETDREKTIYVLYYRDKEDISLKIRNGDIDKLSFGDLLFIEKGSDVGIEYVITEIEGSIITVVPLENHFEGYVKLIEEKINIDNIPSAYKIEKMIVVEDSKYELKIYDNKTFVEWSYLDIPIFNSGERYKVAFVLDRGLSNLFGVNAQLDYVENKKENFPNLLFLSDKKIDRKGFDKEVFDNLYEEGYIIIGWYDDTNKKLKDFINISPRGSEKVVSKRRYSIPISIEKILDSKKAKEIYDNIKTYDYDYYFCFANIKKRFTIGRIIKEGLIQFGTMEKEEFMRELEYRGEKYYLANPDEDISPSTLANNPRRRIEVYKKVYGENEEPKKITIGPTPAEADRGENRLVDYLFDDKLYHWKEQPMGDDIIEIDATPHIQARAIDFVDAGLLLLNDFSFHTNFPIGSEKEKASERKKLIDGKRTKNNFGYLKFLNMLEFVFPNPYKNGTMKYDPILQTDIISLKRDLFPTTFWFSNFIYFYHVEAT